MDAWTKRQLSLLFPRIIMVISLFISVLVLFGAWNPFMFLHFIFAFWVCNYIDKEEVDLSGFFKQRLVCVAIDIAFIYAMFIIFFFDHLFLAIFATIAFNYFFIVFRNYNILDNVQRRMLFLSDPAVHFLLLIVLLLFSFAGS